MKAAIGPCLMKIDPPDRSAWITFIAELYFGSLKDPLAACVHRAYRDLVRTVHGMGRLDQRQILRDQAHEVLIQRLRDLPSLYGLFGGHQAATSLFDGWHKRLCLELIETFGRYELPFHVGQAQKWINMSLKYIYALGEDHIPGFAACYACAHAPLDRILLRQLEAHGLPPLDQPWSRLKDYGRYLSIQQWIRDRFIASPLDVEFVLWREAVYGAESRNCSQLTNQNPVV